MRCLSRAPRALALLPAAGDSGQAAALAAFDEVVAPAARRFRPDIVLVSAGYAVISSFLYGKRKNTVSRLIPACLRCRLKFQQEFSSPPNRRYDAHWRDPLAGLQYRTATYHALAARLAALAGELCGGRLVFLLEGGYDLKALGESVANTFRGVLGEAALDRFNPDLLRDEPMDKVAAVLAEARRIHEL